MRPKDNPGIGGPSQADERLARRLRDAPQRVDLRTLVHLLTAGGEPVRFAGAGEILARASTRQTLVRKCV